MSNCENCERTECTEVEFTEKKPETVPYIVYEAEQDRSERRTNKLIIALIVAIALIFASNAIWLWAWMQYDYVSEEIHVDSADGGNANYIGQDGDIHNYGTDHGEEESTQAQE